MRVYRCIEDFSATNPILTIGMFDGVHAGHRAILRELEQAKKSLNGESVLLTFWPHPRIFFGKTEGFKMLTTMEEKLELLEQIGLDVCLVLPFSTEFAQLSPENYISQIIHRGIGAKKVVIGYDHKYGHNGSGSFELMQNYGKRMGFEVEQVSALTIDEKEISSTKIRNSIAQGNIETANKFLSYQYFINGNVIAGSQIGRTIGFPTANVQVNSSYKEIPAKGVYSGTVKVDNIDYQAVINIGNNPTINTDLPLSVEVHLLDFSQDIYGKNIRIAFAKKLRDEQQFASLTELQKAIQNDVKMVRSKNDI